MSAPMSISQTFSNMTNGTTFLKDEVETTINILQVLIVSVIMICIPISSLSILLVVISSKSYRCPQGILLASLACCDLAVGLLVVPSSFIAGVTGAWVLGDVWCLISGSSLNILTGATAIHITAISLDKYLKVVFPLKYLQNNISTTVTLAFVVIIWIFSCLLLIIPSVVFPGSYTFFPGPLVCISGRWENILLRSAMLGLAICINLVLNIKLALVARRSSRRVNHQGNDLGVRRQDTKGIRTVLMLNITFIAAYLPDVLVYVYKYLFRAPVSAYVAFIVTWLLISNSFFNSILYYKSNANFRKAFTRTMLRVHNLKMNNICICCWSSVASGVDISNNISVMSNNVAVTSEAL